MVLVVCVHFLLMAVTVKATLLWVADMVILLSASVLSVAAWHCAMMRLLQELANDILLDFNIIALIECIKPSTCLS
jgi:hypothetical protein